jgi:hypothetical protein
MHHLLFGLMLPWAAQPAVTTSSSTGYSIQESYRDAQVILLGEIAGGNAIDVGDKVQCRVAVRAERVVKGNVAPGADVNLVWEYTPSPHEPPELTSRVPRAYGLWFLRAGPEGGLTPLRLVSSPGTMGGHFLPLPRVRLSADFAYGPEDVADAKLARELGAVLEYMAAETGEGLNQVRRVGASGVISTRQTPVQAAFHDINAVLSLTDAVAARPMYQHFVASGLANLRVVGVAGLLRGGDVSAVGVLERDASLFSPAMEAMSLTHSLAMIDLGKHSKAMHALARVALAEKKIPALESTMAMKLGWSGRWDAMPYLIAMLESPNAGTRGSALMAVCTAARATGAKSELAGQWKDEMNPFCFNHSPVNDPPREQAAVAFWKSWWADQRTRLRDVALPDVRPPSRYQAAPPADAPVSVEVPMEQRFRAYLNMTVAMNRHRTAVVGGPPSAAKSADDVLLAETIQRVSGRLGEMDQRVRRTLNEARLANRRPDLDEMRAFQEESNGILRQGLDDLRRGLTPPGWTAFEQRLMSMGISSFRLATPVARPPQPRP